MKLKETTRSSETIFEGKVVHLKRDVVILPDGSEAYREVVEHTGGVCIAAVDDERRVFLVDQFRYPIGAVVTELPAGKLERGEDPYAAAVRELREETGCTADEVRSLGSILPSPGYTSERLHLYLATGLHEGTQSLDDGEFLNCYRIPLSEAVSMVRDNRIEDAKSAALLLLADALV